MVQEEPFYGVSAKVCSRPNLPHSADFWGKSIVACLTMSMIDVLICRHLGHPPQSRRNRWRSETSQAMRLLHDRVTMTSHPVQLVLQLKP